MCAALRLQLLRRRLHGPRPRHRHAHAERRHHPRSHPTPRPTAARQRRTAGAHIDYVATAASPTQAGALARPEHMPAQGGASPGPWHIFSVAIYAMPGSANTRARSDRSDDETESDNNDSRHGGPGDARRGSKEPRLHYDSCCFSTRHSVAASRRLQLQRSTALRARLNSRALTAPRTLPTPASHLCHTTRNASPSLR